MFPYFLKVPVAPFTASILLLLLGGILNTVWSKGLTGGREVVTLPAPDTKGSMPLESTLQNRRSIRNFQEGPISLRAVSQLLWAAQGITSRDEFRTAPSAGALYPLEIHVVARNIDGLKKGIFRYTPVDHTLLLTSEGDYSHMLSQAALWQDVIYQAPAVFVISGIQERTTRKYGNRGIRYMYMEAGHAAQNICLQAVALDLSSVTIGAFTDHEVAEILQMDKGEAPLYIIPVGKAR